MVDNVMELLTREYDLRNNLEASYKSLYEIVKMEDSFNEKYNISSAPKHLDLLNEVSKELKRKSYIPKCIYSI